MPRAVVEDGCVCVVEGPDGLAVVEEIDAAAVRVALPLVEADRQAMNEAFFFRLYCSRPCATISAV